MGGRSHRRRLILRFGNLSGFLISLIAGTAGFALWRRYGREHDVDFDAEYYRKLPKDYPPAVAGYLWRFGTSRRYSNWT